MKLKYTNTKLGAKGHCKSPLSLHKGVLEDFWDPYALSFELRWRYVCRVQKGKEGNADQRQKPKVSSTLQKCAIFLLRVSEGKQISWGVECVKCLHMKQADDYCIYVSE